MNVFQRQAWSPYAAGACIGVLSWFAFWSVDRPIGVSTALTRTVGMFESAVAPRHVPANAYFAKFKPVIDWEWMLVIGLAAGALISSRLSRRAPDPSPPEFWSRRFGPSLRRRYIGSFAGGAILMAGARLAGGCTSGHGISGSLQLALSGWVFFAAIFVSGVITAALLYGKEDARG